MKILHVTTEHTAPFKILFEVLKEALVEVNIEFRVDKINMQMEDENISDDSDDDNDDGVNTDYDNEKNIENARKGGIRIKAVDQSKTVLIYMKLNAENFSTFKSSMEKYSIGVNLTQFHKLIKSMDKEDNLGLYIEKDERDFLKIRIDNPEKSKVDIFKLKLLELKNDEITLPPIKFDSVMTINGMEFHRLCREMSQIAEFIEIKCSKNKIIFTCKGDCAERTTTYTTDDKINDGIDIEYSEGVSKDKIIQGVYELKNLILFGKCSNWCGRIQLYMKNDYPLVINYTIANLGKIILCMTPIAPETTRNSNYEDDGDFYSDEEIELI